MALSVKGQRQRRGRGGRLMGEINITPMVDVMLVLLVIFMVAAPMLNTGIDVDLPKSEAKSLPQQSEPPLAVSVTASGELYLQEVAVSREELVEKLGTILAQRSSDKLYLRADGANSYQQVFEIMGLLSGAGYENIALVGDVPG